MLEIKEKRLSPKEYATLKRIHVITVYRRIKAGVLTAYQEAPGYPYEIPVRERLAKHSIS